MGLCPTMAPSTPFVQRPSFDCRINQLPARKNWPWHFGAQNSTRLAENLQRVEIFCRAFESLSFDDESARHYGIVRAQLRREGRPIGGNDLMIASIAIANSHVLVTRNVGEFSRVSGLEMERW